MSALLNAFANRRVFFVLLARFLLRDPPGADRLDPAGVDGVRKGRPDGDRDLLPRRPAVHVQVPLVPADGPVRPPVPRASPRVDAGDPGGPFPRHRRDGVLRAEGAPRRTGAPVVPRRLLQREPGHRGRRLAHRGPRPGGTGTGSGGAHPRVPRGDAHLGRDRPDPRRPDAVARRLSPDGRLPRRGDDRLLSRPGTGTGREEAEDAEGGGRRAVPGVFRAGAARSGSCSSSSSTSSTW